MRRLYTIGEVSSLTGIDKRTLKYYIERDMIKPSNKKVGAVKNHGYTVNRMQLKFVRLRCIESWDIQPMKLER